MKFNKALRNKLIVLFAMTAVFASLAFSMTASAESLVNFSRGILSNVSFAANTSQSATPEPTPPKRNEKDENSESSNGNRTDRDDEGEEDDADIPKFMIGKINKEDYRNRRTEHINRLRGIERGRPHDPGARGRAIRQLDRQEGMPDRNTQTIRLGDANDPNPDVSAGGVMGAADANSSSNSPAWTSIGPAPIPNGQTSGLTHAVSGRVTVIAIHPTNSDIAYVGTAQGGVYRTLDGGATWTAIFDNAQTLVVGSIAIAPSQPSTIYVGTGEGNFGCDTYFGVGVYRIDNADGSTPVMTGPFAQETGTGKDVLTGRAISKILVHPNNPDITFLAVNNGGVGGIGCDAHPTQASSRGLYRSTNATSSNATFQKITTNTANSGNRSVTDMEFEPGNPNTMLVGVYGFSTANDGGVYRSTNVLAPTPTFTNTLSAGTTTVTARVELAINKVGNAVTVYAATSDASGTVKRSTDGGVTWSAALASANQFCGGQCTYDMAIAVDPTDANVVYIGGNAGESGGPAILKKSTNALSTAPTFNRAQAGLHADTHAIEVDPSDNNTVWTGNDGGVWKSTNGGANWTSLNNTGFNATQFQSIALHPSDANYTIGGTQDNGTLRMRPDGTWTRTDYGDGGFALIDQNAAGTTTVRQYHTYYNQAGSLMGFATTTSSTAFENWSFYGCGGTSNGISCNDTAVLFYAPMALGPGNPNSVYYATDRLYRSINNGVTMTAVSPQFASGTAVSAIGISPQNDAVRIVGLRNGKVFRTMTGGATSAAMTDVTGAIPAKYISRAVIDPNNANTAYVTIAAFFGNSTAHIYKTTNLNATTPTWTPIGGSTIPDIPVNAFVVDPSDSKMLYAGTDIGVYRSTDGGATWNSFSDGLPRVAVFDMAIQNGNRTLRIATHGRGMWEMSIATSPAVIEGTVTDSSTGDPIAQARVTAGSNTTIANDYGFYRFANIPAATYNVTASATGYNGSTATGVTATNGSTTTRNFTLTAAQNSNCMTDTTQSDFEAGLPASVDTSSNPGDVKLALSRTSIDQTTLNFFVDSITSTTWQAQTFIPGTSGLLNQVDFQAALSSTGTPGTVVVEIRNTVSGAPGTNVLATTNLTSISGTGNAWYSVMFANPTNVTAGTSYSIVLRASSGGPYRAVRANGNVYANGAWYQSTTSGSSWAAPTAGSPATTQDLAFRAYVGVYTSSGTLVSSLKDANMSNGTSSAWTNLTWTASTPAGTDVRFQVAGGNNADSISTFVGPDGTANTFFSNGASLSQFNGMRYLRYKAYFSTTSVNLTPALSDVSVCNNNAPLPDTNLVVGAANGTYGGTTTLTARLTADDTPLSGRVITFKLNGSNFTANRATTDANGVATISNVSLSGINAGTYSTAVNARFAGDNNNAGSTNSGSLTVDQAVLTITADNKSRTYRAANPTFTFTPGGFVSGDTASVISGIPSFETTADVTSNVGNYPINISAGTLNAANYSFNFVAGTLTVTKATPTVNWSNPADISYGTALSETQLNATAANPNDGSSVAGSYTYSPASGSVLSAGNKTLSVQFTPDDTANYDSPSQKSVSINVVRAVLTITADDKTKVYGTANPSFTFTPSGFVNNDTAASAFTGAPQLTTTALMGSGIGSYDINAANGSLNSSNYSFSFVKGTLTVTKAVLTITADNKSKVYGSNLPSLTYTPSGFASGDTASVLTGAPLLDTTATVSSNVGSYPITIGAGTIAATNYSFNFVNGAMSVTPAPLTIKAEDKSKQYSDPIPAFSSAYTGFVLGQGPADLAGTLSFTTSPSANALSPAGNYAIVPSGQSSSNYAITYQNGVLMVVQENATITYTGDTLVSTSRSNSTPTVNLSALVTEEQDGSLGNTLAGKTVRFSVYKYSDTTLSNPTTATALISSNNTAVTSLPLDEDNYVVKIELLTNNQYAAQVETSAFTVVSPSTGMTTGGGWVRESNGNRGHLSFTMRYVPGGMPKGNNIYSYRDRLDLAAFGAPAGLRDYNIVVKSNALTAMQLDSTATPATGTFTGKTNVMAVDRITGIAYNIGAGLNLQFQVDVTDQSESSASNNPDKYALRVWNTTGDFKVAGTKTAQLPLGGGNIQVK